jgi:hypothetical protein
MVKVQGETCTPRWKNSRSVLPCRAEGNGTRRVELALSSTCSKAAGWRRSVGETYSDSCYSAFSRASIRRAWWRLGATYTYLAVLH